MTALLEPSLSARPAEDIVAAPSNADLLRPTAATAAALGALCAGVGVATRPVIVVALVMLAVVSWVIWTHPHVAAYMVIGVTPLVVGIDRGKIIPVLRPNEALAFYLIGLLVLRGAFAIRVGQPFPRLRLHPVERSIVLLALTSSVVPVVFLVLRGGSLTGDDITYSLVLWKYLGVYALVRLTVKTDNHIRRCLQISMAVGFVVGGIAVLQSLDLLGVRGLLATLYAPFGYTGALALPRGSSTLSLPAATADLLIFNLAIAVAIITKERRAAVWYSVAAGVFVLGTLAAAEFSSAFGLLVALVCLAAVLRRLRLLIYLPFGASGALAAMWPVVSSRLAGFQSVSGLPVSWVGRIRNLKTYFLPKLFSGTNPLLGVRPSARVPVPSQATGFVWIESGYIWLLWGGGVFLFASFVYFTIVSIRLCLSVARPLTTWRSVAAVAAFTAVVVVAFLMIFDPHLTYRGSADLMFSLLALTVAGRAATDVAESTAVVATKATRRRARSVRIAGEADTAKPRLVPLISHRAALVVGSVTRDLNKAAQQDTRLGVGPFETSPDLKQRAAPRPEVEPVPPSVKPPSVPTPRPLQSQVPSDMPHSASRQPSRPAPELRAVMSSGGSRGLVYPPIIEKDPPGRIVLLIAAVCVLLLAAGGFILLRTDIRRESSLGSGGTATAPSSGRTVEAAVTSEISFGTGPFVTSSQHVVFDQPVSSITLSVPPRAATVMGGIFNPRIGSLRVLSGQATPFVVTTPPRLGRSVSIELASPTSQLDIIFVAAGVVVRTKPQQSSHRALALVTPLLVTPTPGAATTFHINSPHVTKVTCGSTGKALVACGRRSADGWTVGENAADSRGIVVVAQIDSP